MHDNMHNIMHYDNIIINFVSKNIKLGFRGHMRYT